MVKSRKEVKILLRRYLDTHGVFREEAYKLFYWLPPFITIPENVKRRIHPDIIKSVIDETWEHRLHVTVSKLQQRYDWIGDWSRRGRENQWLILESRDQVMDLHGKLYPGYLKEGRTRLRELEEIRHILESEKSQMLRDFASEQFWESQVSYKRSRKNWDPRETR